MYVPAYHFYINPPYIVISTVPLMSRCPSTPVKYISATIIPTPRIRKQYQYLHPPPPYMKKTPITLSNMVKKNHRK